MTLVDVIRRQVADLPPAKQTEVLDFVLFLHTRSVTHETSESLETRQQRLAAALERLRRLGTFSGIADPVAWQRDLREDRPLPGRET